MIYLIIIIFFIFFFFQQKEHFNQKNEIKKKYDYINWKELIFNCKNNLDTIYFFDKNSITLFKNYIKENLKHKYITKQSFFLKTIETNSEYTLEVFNYNNNILLKIIIIDFKIKNNIFIIININIKNNTDLLFDGYDKDYQNYFVHPEDFSWQENPYYQNVIIPDNNNYNESSNYNLKMKAWNISKIYNDNRKNYFNLGRCFKSNISDITNEESCKKNFGIWDTPCKTNFDCPYYVDSFNRLKIGRGACLSGYCEFPKGVERVGYKKKLKKEMNRINKLKSKKKKYNL